MIELDNIEYNVNTPEENVQSMVSAINTWCANNNITNRDGDVIYIEANYANPLWMILYGVGYLASKLQSLIYSAGCALSIHSSSDKQLLDIADVAGIKRKDPSHTIVLATVYANLPGDDAVDCRITTGLTATVTVLGESVVFSPAYDVTIPVGGSRTIVLVSQNIGSYTFSTNYITTFDENPEGFRQMYSQASVPGQTLEPISALRERIQKRVKQGTMLDWAAENIEQLPGVSACNIYFNRSVTESEFINGIEVLPRHAFLFVQGFNTQIAETYYTYMLAETTKGTNEHTITQTYTTVSGQQLPVYIITPDEVFVYARIYFNIDIDDVTAQQMKDMICTLAATRTIGQVLTSTEIVDVIQANFAGYSPAGCQLSLDNDDFGYQVQPADNELIVFDIANLRIIGAT